MEAAYFFSGVLFVCVIILINVLILRFLEALLGVSGEEFFHSDEEKNLKQMLDSTSSFISVVAFVMTELFVVLVGLSWPVFFGGLLFIPGSFLLLWMAALRWFYPSVHHIHFNEIFRRAMSGDTTVTRRRQ